MSNTIFFSWQRSVPGREMMSAEHFTSFVGYLTNLKSSGTISNFETVFLNPAAGSAVNGFFLIQGDTQKLHTLTETNDWIEHMVRASMHLENMGTVLGISGNEIATRMQVWTKTIPTK